MTDEPTTNDAMTAAEVAAMWNTTAKRVYGLVASGQIPALRLGRRLLFSRSRLSEMLREGNVGTEGAGHSTEVRS